MAVDIQVLIIDREGDQADRHTPLYQRQTYTNWQKMRLSLAAGTKTEVRVPFDTIEFLYIETAGSSVQVFKDLSAESWSVDESLLAFDVSISQLHLQAAAAATVTLFLGGQ